MYVKCIFLQYVEKLGDKRGRFETAVKNVIYMAFQTNKYRYMQKQLLVHGFQTLSPLLSRQNTFLRKILLPLNDSSNNVSYNNV